MARCRYVPYRNSESERRFLQQPLSKRSNIQYLMSSSVPTRLAMRDSSSEDGVAWIGMVVGSDAPGFGHSGCNSMHSTSIYNPQSTFKELSVVRAHHVQPAGRTCQTLTFLSRTYSKGASYREGCGYGYWRSTMDNQSVMTCEVPCGISAHQCTRITNRTAFFYYERRW
jgi:hypothetical protein